MEYPLQFELYSVEELTFLIQFLNKVDASKHSKLNKEALKEDYKKYRTIIANKSEEKRIDKAFEKQSGVSIYRLMQSID